MLRVQIVEREGAKLFSTLKTAMRDGDLRTFSLQKRGTKVTHVSAPGWINWTHDKGVISCEVLSPSKLGHEWQILSNFIGRLAARFGEAVHSINIQFVEPQPKAMAKRAGR